MYGKKLIEQFQRESSGASNGLVRVAKEFMEETSQPIEFTNKLDAGQKGYLREDGTVVMNAKIDDPIHFRENVQEILSNPQGARRPTQRIEELKNTDYFGSEEESLFDPEQGIVSNQKPLVFPELKEGETRLKAGDKLPKELLKTKPLYARDPVKWLQEGKDIVLEKDGVWKYTNKEGITVRYPGGYPDFKEAGVVLREIELDEFQNYGRDKRQIEKKLGEPTFGYVWHHKENMHTVQEVQKEVHEEFTHIGGMSITKTRKKLEGRDQK